MSKPKHTDNRVSKFTRSTGQFPAFDVAGEWREKVASMTASRSKAQKRQALDRVERREARVEIKEWM